MPAPPPPGEPGGLARRAAVPRAAVALSRRVPRRIRARDGAGLRRSPARRARRPRALRSSSKRRGVCSPRRRGSTPRWRPGPPLRPPQPAQGADLRATVMVTLALGIGANAAMFQLIDAVGLRSLPVADPEPARRSAHHRRQARLRHHHELLRPADAAAVGRAARAAEGLLEHVRVEQQPGARGDLPELRARHGVVRERRLFGTLGITPWRARRSAAGGDEAPCPAQRAMVSHGYWMRELGGRELTASDRAAHQRRRDARSSA